MEPPCFGNNVSTNKTTPINKTKAVIKIGVILLGSLVVYKNKRSYWKVSGQEVLLLNKQVILNLFQDLPIVLFGFCIVVVVILESCSPGSVVS